MKLKIVVPPAAEPLNLTKARDFMRVDQDTDESVITPIIKMSREYCEVQQGRKYVTQTIDGFLDAFPCGDIEFNNCSPVQSIISIKYIDNTGLEHIIEPSDYELDNVSFVNKINLTYGKKWPGTLLKTVNGVVIRFIAGYEPNGEDLTVNIPETVKQAMVLQMKLLYETYSDEDQKRMERARDALLGVDRVVPV